MKTSLLPALAAAAMLFAGAAAPVRAGAAVGVLSAQDNVEIQQLYARYNIAIDTGDAEGYADHQRGNCRCY